MENSNQQGVLVSSSPEEEVPSPTCTTAQAQSTTRLYECSFCKKGFSNAQALGGHMNIHRKDKAKLKQASKENQKSMDIGQPKILNPLTPSSTSLNNNSLEFTAGQVIKSTTFSSRSSSTTTTSTSKITNILTNKWPPPTTVVPPHHHQDQELCNYESHVAPEPAEHKQLPLFVETSAARAAALPPISQHHHHRGNNAGQESWEAEDRSPVHLSNQGSFGPELDLELRLGHEPPKPTVALGTRKFF